MCRRCTLSPGSTWNNAAQATGVRTADVFLLWRGLIWICGLLDVDNKFALRFVLVHRSSGIVDLVAVDAIVGLP